jgi:CBS domain-containing protein
MPHRHMSEVIRRAPIVLAESETVQEACRTMHQHRIGAIMVTDKADKLVGIFTGRDTVRLLADGRSPARTHLHEVMTRKPECVGPECKAIEVLRLMQDGGFRHVPVVEHGHIVGIVSVGDFRAIEHARLDEETGIWERI